MRMYGELASWFHLISHPDEYAAEADHVARIVDAVCGGAAKTLLELGSGGGNNASHLKRRFTCTLSDLSPAMLELSATINPECEHVVGDMRTLRLGGCSTSSSSTMRSTTWRANPTSGPRSKRRRRTPGLAARQS